MKVTELGTKWDERTVVSSKFIENVLVPNLIRYGVITFDYELIVGNDYVRVRTINYDSAVYFLIQEAGSVISVIKISE